MIASGAAAQDSPSKPLRLVVGFPPGGANDIVARQLAPKLAERLNTQVVVDNRPGANAVLGTDHVAKSAPDGYTVAIASLSPLVFAAVTYSKVPYDTLTDFVPVTTVAMTPMVLAAHPSLPARSLKELVALAKKSPAPLNFATTGSGGMTRMVVELMNITAGVKIQHVPYKGAAMGLTDAMGGHVHGIAEALPVIYPQIRGGKLRGIALASDRRSDLLPDLATSAEQGFPAMYAVNWYGVMAPARTPRAIVDRLHDAFNKSAVLPDVREKFAAVGVETMTSPSPDKFAEFLKSEMTRWGKVARSAQIKAD